MTATQRAIGLLSRREHSRTELVRKLVAKGVGTDEAQGVVAKLADANWQDDSRFADNLVRSRASAGYGPIRIRAELAMHGMPREAIAAALERFDGDWSRNARDLVGRRLGAVPVNDRLARHKAADLLIRRGFDGQHVRAATAFDPEE